MRTRCKGAPGDEVLAQFREALPHIVTANVEKAKGGSLIHTKWLWDKAEKALARGESEGARGARASLAELLMEQLKETL